jgi:hypothetical protein
VRYVPAVFALFVATVGWYYMFYSTAAVKLGEVEPHPLNVLRIRLRRVGGFFMLLLAVCFFALFFTVDLSRPTYSAFFVFLATFLVLGTIVVLALIDLRLTWKLRRITHQPPPH